MWNQTSQYSRKRIILTPMIDVLFIILIFFMLVSSFNLDRGISIQSFSELGSSINSKVIAVIDIGKDKRLINGLEVKIDNLADDLINLGTKKDIQILTELNCCIVFFISPKKINKNIPFIKENFADREILICREISKFYEEYLRFSINELNLFSKPPKGELTVVISEKKIDKINSHLLSESDKSNINKMINKLSVKEITSLISQNSKVSKKEIYDYCTKISEALGLDGLHDIDLMTGDDGTVCVLEVNPRPSGSVVASHKAGFPIMLASIAKLIDKTYVMPSRPTIMI